MSFSTRTLSAALFALLLVWPSFAHGQTTMSLDKSSLRFAGSTAVSTIGPYFIYATGPQAVRLLQEGSGLVTWTVSSNQPWLAVTPASGTGPAELSVWLASAQSLPTSGEVTASGHDHAYGSGTGLDPRSRDASLVFSWRDSGTLWRGRHAT
jgi:hypothetical protein